MKTVLIIDSSALFREYLSSKLSGHGLNVITAPNGLDGSVKLRNEMPDLTILDYHLPMKSGKDILIEMRKNPNTAKSAAIIVSTKIDTSKVVEVAKYNVSKFFTKPLKYDALLSTIGEILKIDFKIDTAPCRIDAHINDDIIFIEIAEGLNSEKIELLKYKITELLRLYSMQIPKVLIMLASIELSSADIAKIKNLFETVLNSANTSPRLIKVLTRSSLVKDYLKKSDKLKDINCFEALPEAMDELLGIRPDSIAHDEIVVNRLLQNEEDSTESTFDMRFASERKEQAAAQTLEGAANVAIVDDDFVVRELVKSVFEESNWTVQTYADGQEFVQDIEKKEYDIIFLDLMMPKMNGFQVLEILKKKNIKIPIVVFTALSKREMVAKAVELGVSSYIIKPIKPVKLVQKAKEILNVSF